MHLIQSPTHNTHPHHPNRSSSVTASFRPRRMTSPPSFSGAARLFAKLSGCHQQQQQQSIEHKMAELRAAYATQPTAAQTTTKRTLSKEYKSASHRPGRTSLPTPSLSDMLELPQFSSRSCVPSRRASTASCFLPAAPSIMDLAASAGLLSLSPSDLVFESSVFGIAYYDFVLSVSEVAQCCGHCGNSVASVAVRHASNMTPTCSASVTTSTRLEPPLASATCNCRRTRDMSPSTKRRVHGTGSDPTPPSLANGVEATTTQQPIQHLQRKTSAVGGVFAKLTESGKRRPQTATAATLAANKVANGCTTQVNVEIVQLAEICEKGTDMDQNGTVYRLLLAKLDKKTNVEWFESVLVPSELLEKNGIPVNQLSLLTMGILVWRCTLNNARLLCLVNGMQQQQQMPEDGNTTAASFEALKRAACKYKCMHHVLTIGQRRSSAGSTHSSCSSSSRRSSTSSGSHLQHNQQDSGMKLRVLMCQSRNELPEIPAHALRDAKFLLASNTNPLFCLCFPLT